nr:recombinase family protein [Brevundimonas naejangsanensis]
MKIIAYARYSSTAQEGTSIERQHEAAKEYADSRGWAITEYVKDEARSAFHAEHKRIGNLGRILKRVESREIGAGDVLIVESVDRLSRQDVMTALDTFIQVINAGITIITTMDGQELNRTNYQNQWTNIIMVMAKMATAHEESLKRSERRKAAWTKSRKEGRMTILVPAWLNMDRTVRADRVQIVKTIFQLCDEGKGSNLIAKHLNQSDIRSWGSEKTSGTWSSSYVSRVLRNRAVIGEFQAFQMVDGKETPIGEAVPDYFPRVIDQSLFDRVQDKVAARAFGGAGSGRKGGNTNIVKGLMQCGECGSNFHMLHSGKYPFLKCSGHRQGKCTNGVAFHYTLFEAHFLNSIRELQIETGTNDIESAINEQLAEARNTLVTLDKNISFIIDKMIEMDSPALTTRLAKSEDQKRETLALIDRLEAELRRATVPVDQTQTDIISLYQALISGNDDTYEETRQMIHEKIKELITGISVQKFGVPTLVVFLKDGTSYTMWNTKPEKWGKGRLPLEKMLWTTQRTVVGEPSEWV